MADSLPEDVAALCDHAGLDSSLYKDFTTQRNTVAASSRTAARAATSKRDAPGSDQDQLSVTSGSAVTASLNPDPPVESHSSPPPVQQHVTLVEQPEHGGTPASMGNSNLLELPLPSHRGFATTRISPTPADNPRITRDRWSAIQDAFRRVRLTTPVPLPRTRFRPGRSRCSRSAEAWGKPPLQPRWQGSSPAWARAFCWPALPRTAFFPCTSGRAARPGVRYGVFLCRATMGAVPCTSISIHYPI